MSLPAPLNPVDLHCHSRASDGTHAPAELVRLAREGGLSGVALTDHDTLAGTAEAKAEADRLGLDFLAGLEVSCLFPRPGTMHVLGYGLDIDSEAARKLTQRLNAARDERIRLILKGLGRVGVHLSLREVLDAAGEGASSIGRPHVARVLIAKGHARSNREAFDRFLGGGGVAYVQNHPYTAEEAIGLIRQAGGVASLAHPLQLRRQSWAQLEALIADLADNGLEAIETIHSTHTTDDVHRLTRLADRVGLLTTGGSDFHGAAKPWIRLGEAGRRSIPRSFFDDVAARVASRRSAPAARDAA